MPGASLTYSPARAKTQCFFAVQSNRLLIMSLNFLTDQQR